MYYFVDIKAIKIFDCSAAPNSTTIEMKLITKYSCQHILKSIENFIKFQTDIKLNLPHITSCIFSCDYSNSNTNSAVILISD